MDHHTKQPSHHILTRRVFPDLWRQALVLGERHQRRVREAHAIAEVQLAAGSKQGGVVQAPCRRHAGIVPAGCEVGTIPPHGLWPLQALALRRTAGFLRKNPKKPKTPAPHRRCCSVFVRASTWLSHSQRQPLRLTASTGPQRLCGDKPAGVRDMRGRICCRQTGRHEDRPARKAVQSSTQGSHPSGSHIARHNAWQGLCSWASAVPAHIAVHRQATQLT